MAAGQQKNNNLLRFVIYLLIISISMGGERAISQQPEYHVQMLYNKNIINTSFARDLTIDNNGFLWVLSPSSIQRYDGKTVRVFYPPGELLSILSEPDGGIWITSSLGCYKFINEYKGFLLQPVRHKQEQKIIRIVNAGNRGLYGVSKNGLFHWNPVNAVFEQVSLSLGKYDYISVSDISYQSGRLYFSTNDSMIQFDLATSKYKAVFNRESHYIIPFTGDSVLLANWDSRSYLLDYSQKTKTQYDIGPTGFSVINGGFWLNDTECFITTGSSGCYTINRVTGEIKKVVFYEEGQVLSNGIGAVTKVFLDNERTAWLLTENGLLYFKPFEFGFRLRRNSGLSNTETWSNNVRAFVEDSDKNLWFATANGFCEWKADAGTITPYFARQDATDYLNYPSIRGFIYDGRNIIIGQTNKGIWIFNPKSRSFRRPVYPSGPVGDTLEKKLNADFNQYIFRLRNGDFILCSRDNTYLLNSRDYSISVLNSPVARNRNNMCTQDEMGRIWLLGAREIACIDSNYALLARNRQKSEYQYNTILQVSANSCWVGSKGLLEFELAGDSIRGKEVLPVLKNARIDALFKDQDGNVWIGTDAGLYRYFTKEAKLELFDFSDNIQNNQFIMKTGFRSSTGMVYFGGTNGINYFYPEKISPVREVLKVHIMHVSINGDDSLYFLQKNFTSLPYYKKEVEVSYLAPYFFNASKVQYRYKLEGRDKQWTYVGGNTSVRFSSLPAGTYVFTVEASLNGKDWHAADNPFSFHINPPFWYRWWFIALAGVLISALVYLFIRRKIKQIRKKNAIAQQLIQLEINALRARMNPHFIFNAMNSIQQFTLMNDTDNANKFISKFSKLLRKILHQSEKDTITIAEEIETLKLYLEIESLRMGDDFSYTINNSLGLDDQVYTIPNMIIQPFVENAINHGLVFKEGLKKLEIHFSTDDNEALICEINDNGIGREKARDIKGKKDETHQSMGMKLILQRLELIQQSSESKPSVEVIDLFSPEGNPAGTLVRITIP